MPTINDVPAAAPVTAQDYINQLFQASIPQPSGPSSFDEEAARNKAKLAMGLALMQSYKPETGLAGHIGQAIAGGQSVLDREKASATAKQTEQQKLDIQRGGLAIDAKKAQAQEEYWKGALSNERAKAARETQKDLEKGVNELAKLYAGVDNMGNARPVTYQLYNLARYNKTGKIAIDDPVAATAIQDMVKYGVDVPDGKGGFVTKKLTKQQAEAEYVKEMRKQLRATQQQVKATQAAQPAPGASNQQIPTDPAALQAMLAKNQEVMQQKQAAVQLRRQQEQQLAEATVSPVAQEQASRLYPMGGVPDQVELTQKLMQLQALLNDQNYPQDLKQQAAQNFYRITAQLSQLQPQQVGGQ